MIFSPDSMKEARKRKLLTQHQLADALGVHHRTVQQWEAGQIKPTYEKAAAIERVLEIDLDIGTVRPANASASSIPRLAPMPPSKAKHVRQGRQHLRAAMDTMAAVQEQLLETTEAEKLNVALRALAKVQRAVIAAQDELDKLLEG